MRWAAGALGATGLSLVVHAALVVALAFGVSWKSPVPEPVQATLWSELPPLPAPPPPPNPVTPAPAPKPLPAPKPAPKPKTDIALAQEKRKQARETAREEVRRKAEGAKAAERERLAQEKAKEVRKEVQRLAEAREKAERTARLKAELDRQLRAEMAAELAAEAEDLRRQKDKREAQAQQGSRQQRQVLEAQDRIRLKIRGLLRLPPGLQGNPEAVYRVTLLPNGEVSDVKLVTSSGQPAYDREVEHAIYKASPLPLPSDPVAAREFRDGLTLLVRPQDG